MTNRKSPAPEPAEDAAAEIAAPAQEPAPKRDEEQPQGGGSYIRNEDGSLTLVESTKPQEA